PAAPVIQRKPEPQRPAPAQSKPPARAESKPQAAPAAPRRRPRFEEVSTPGSAQPEVQRSPEPEPTPAPTPPAPTEEAGPMRWDHLGDLPPSIQRQLERVQQRLAEQSGLRPTPTENPPPASATTDQERPFRPRNINPPPTPLAESLPSRLPLPEP